jgi:hypothetical protein
VTKPGDRREVHLLFGTRLFYTINLDVSVAANTGRFEHSALKKVHVLLNPSLAARGILKNPVTDGKFT